MITDKYQFPKITKAMYKDISDWYHTHNNGKCSHKYCGPIGGQLSFEITPTSIGDFMVVKCICGEKLEFEEL